MIPFPTEFLSTSSLLENAKTLQKNGFSLVPVKGKDIPVVKWGIYQQKQSTLVEIEAWSRQHHDINFALVTGLVHDYEEKVCVVDADSHSAIEWVEENLPQTPCKTKSNKGMHYYYKITHSQRNFANKNKGFPDPFRTIDVRCEGGYIMIAGSRHPSGRLYEQIGDLPHMDILPFLTREQLRYIELGGREEPQPQLVAKIQHENLAINPDFHAIYSNLCTRLGVPEKDQVLTKCPAHAEKNPSFSMGKSDGKIKFFCHAGCTKEAILAALGVEFKDLFEYHYEYSKHSPVVHVVEEEIYSVDEETKLSKNLYKPPGFVGEVADFINQNAIKEQPILTLGAAFAFLGALLGRKICSETDIRTNLYMVGVGESGCGKEAARTFIKKSCEQGHLEKYLIEDIASDVALFNAVKEHPSSLFLIDELGAFFATIAGKSAPPHLQNVITTLMKMYSSSNSILMGKNYANRDGKNPRYEITSPNLCMYATTTQESLLKRIASSYILDGFLNRIVFLFSETKNPEKRVKFFDKIPESFLEQFIDFHKMSTNSEPGTGNIEEITVVRPQKIMFAENASKRALEIDHYFSDLQDKMTHPFNVMVTRAYENTVKIALILAVANGFQKIEMCHLDYAFEFIDQTGKITCDKFKDSIYDSEMQRLTQKVKKILRESGRDGLTQSQLYLKTQFLTKKEREEIIDCLLQSEEISFKMVKNSQRESKVFFALKKK